MLEKILEVQSMNMKYVKIFAFILVAVLITGIVAGCGNNQQAGTANQAQGGTNQTQGGAAESTNGADQPLRVALIGRNFNDGASVEDMAIGAARAEQDFNIVLSLLESSSPATFEEDVLAMARANDLVITAFPWMSDAVVSAANEFPDTMFSSIFQFINAGDQSVPNIWSSEFHGQAAFYIAGYIASQVTQTNRIGLLIGGEEPTPNAEGNAFMRGVRRGNPDAVVNFAFIGSYEDPARGYEIAVAMISGGVDVLQTSAAASNAGVVEAAMEAGVIVACEITDYFDIYEGFMGIIGIGFGDTTYQSIRYFVEGNFPGGEHGIRDMSNGGYHIDWDSYLRFADSHEFGANLRPVISSAQDIERQILSGELVIDFDPTVPNWSRISQE